MLIAGQVSLRADQMGLSRRGSGVDRQPFCVVVDECVSGPVGVGQGRLVRFRIDVLELHLGTHVAAGVQVARSCRR